MKVAIVGTRGIPAKYGGFETFAQEISPLLVRNGFEITIYCDNIKNKNAPTSYMGAKLSYQKTSKSNHSLLYYLEGIFIALKENDLILVTGTAGAFFYFLNIIFRKIIITNTDGIESRRAKWSPFKRFLIKLSETLSIQFSTHLIADSKGIRDYIIKSYPKINSSKIDVIEYGAEINQLINVTTLGKYQLKHKSYFLVVSRLEPENNLKMIIEGYKLTNQEKPLIIVGNILETKYVQDLIKYASRTVQFVGGIYNKNELKALRYSAFAYIHGHSVGGTNPSLLEALGSGNISICHDNLFNREVTDDKQIYFKDEKELANALIYLSQSTSEELKKYEIEAIKRIKEYYNWENISNKYSNLFRAL